MLKFRSIASFRKILAKNMQKTCDIIWIIKNVAYICTRFKAKSWLKGRRDSIPALCRKENWEEKGRKKYLRNFGKDKLNFYLCRPKAKEFLAEFKKAKGPSFAKAREGEKVLWNYEVKNQARCDNLVEILVSIKKETMDWFWRDK